MYVIVADRFSVIILRIDTVPLCVINATGTFHHLWYAQHCRTSAMTCMLYRNIITVYLISTSWQGGVGNKYDTLSEVSIKYTPMLAGLTFPIFGKITESL